MKTVYQALWALFMVGLFALVDYRLPAHGFEWVQSSEWWQAIKVGVLYALLPYLGLRLFEIVAVGKNQAQNDPPTTIVVEIQQQLQQLTTVLQQALPPPQQEQQQLSQEQQQALPSPQQDLLLPDNLPSWDVSELHQPQENAAPETDIDRDLVQAVRLYAQWGSYAKAAARLGGKITGEGIRQRVLSAYQKDPQWVMKVLPYDKLPKL